MIPRIAALTHAKDYSGRLDLYHGEYMENLRNIYLFVAAIEEGEEFPGSQAGVAYMVSSARDAPRWDSSAFWHWNLRMQVAANIGVGLTELNAPHFNP
jgi:hypothetical protein